MAVDSGNFEDWFVKAENDLKAGQGILYYYEDPPTDTICYHAHQVAEKALKGFLIFKSSNMPKTHDLIELINLCIARDNKLTVLKDEVEVLNKYYLEAKYPPDQPIIYPKSEAEEVISIAGRILKTLEEKIK